MQHQPLNVSYDIGIDEHDHEGRVVTLEKHGALSENIHVRTHPLLLYRLVNS